MKWEGYYPHSPTSNGPQVPADVRREMAWRESAAMFVGLWGRDGLPFRLVWDDESKVIMFSPMGSELAHYEKVLIVVDTDVLERWAAASRLRMSVEIVDRAVQAVEYVDEIWGEILAGIPPQPHITDVWE